MPGICACVCAYLTSVNQAWMSNQVIQYTPVSVISKWLKGERRQSSQVWSFPKSEILGGVGSWNLHFSNHWKCTNFLKDAHLGLLLRHGFRKAVFKDETKSSRATYQKSAKAWEMLVSAWEYEITTKCVGLAVDAWDLRALKRRGIWQHQLPLAFTVWYV